MTPKKHRSKRLRQSSKKNLIEIYIDRWSVQLAIFFISIGLRFYFQQLAILQIIPVLGMAIATMIHYGRKQEKKGNANKLALATGISTWAVIAVIDFLRQLA